MNNPQISLDWETIHHRLAASHVALAENFALAPEVRTRILRARAELLAKVPENQTPPGHSLEVVEFLLGSEHYGIELSSIREIGALKNLQPVPGNPKFILGLIHIRGQVLSVMDIRGFFGLPDQGPTDLNKVLILKAARMEAGVLADAILSVRRIPLEDIQPGLPTLTGIRADYMKGVTKEALIILDAEKLLSDGRIRVDD